MTEIAPELSNLEVRTYPLTIPNRGTWNFRELTVKENDDCREAATSKGKDGDELFNGRTMMRLMIIAASVEPKLDVRHLETLPQRVYAKIVEFVSDLNDATSLDFEQEPAKNS